MSWGHRAFFELCWASCSHRLWVIYIHFTFIYFICFWIFWAGLKFAAVCWSFCLMLPAAAQEVVAIVARLHRIASHCIAGRRSRLRHGSSLRSLSCLSLDTCSILSEFINALSKIIFTYFHNITISYCQHSSQVVCLHVKLGGQRSLLQLPFATKLTQWCGPKPMASTRYSQAMERVHSS